MLLLLHLIYYLAPKSKSNKDMKTSHIFCLSALTLVLGACGGNKPADKLTFDNLPVIASLETIESGSVRVLHLDKMSKDTLVIPLSQYLEDFHLIRLDNRDEALTRGYGTFFGNYLITGGSSREACRLFDKEGRFLCQVGNNGQGPGEYWAVYDKQIDEENRRIYLMPWNAKNLLVYNLDDGSYLSSIPLPTLVPKGVFTVDAAKQVVTVGMLAFSNIEGASVVWQQDFDGNVLQRIDAAGYSVQPDFSNEVYNSDNMPGTFDFYLSRWAAKKDSLYHYQPDENRLQPVFTLDMPDDPLQHGFYELPNCFLTDITMEVTQVQYGSYVSKRATVMVDKQTGKGAYVKFVNDLAGDMPLENAVFGFNKGHFVHSIEPGELATYLENALAKSEGLSKKKREEWTKLKESINENDNAYLFVGKIK